MHLFTVVKRERERETELWNSYTYLNPDSVLRWLNKMECQKRFWNVDSKAQFMLRRMTVSCSENCQPTSPQRVASSMGCEHVGRQFSLPDGVWMGLKRTQEAMNLSVLGQLVMSQPSWPTWLVCDLKKQTKKRHLALSVAAVTGIKYMYKNIKHSTIYKVDGFWFRHWSRLWDRANIPSILPHHTQHNLDSALIIFRLVSHRSLHFVIFYSYGTESTAAHGHICIQQCLVHTLTTNCIETPHTDCIEMPQRVRSCQNRTEVTYESPTMNSTFVWLLGLD